MDLGKKVGTFDKLAKSDEMDHHLLHLVICALILSIFAWILSVHHPKNGLRGGGMPIFECHFIKNRYSVQHLLLIVYILP